MMIFVFDRLGNIVGKETAGNNPHFLLFFFFPTGLSKPHLLRVVQTHDFVLAHRHSGFQIFQFQNFYFMSAYSNTSIAATIFQSNRSSLSGFQFPPIPNRTTAITGTTIMFGLSWYQYLLRPLRHSDFWIRCSTCQLPLL